MKKEMTNVDYEQMDNAVFTFTFTGEELKALIAALLHFPQKDEPMSSVMTKCVSAAADKFTEMLDDKVLDSDLVFAPERKRK